MYKKSISIVLWVLITLSGLEFALIHASHHNVATGSLSVSGVIASNVTWTKANSPYNFVGPIQVKRDATLTVGAYTTLNLNNYYLRVDGSLIIEPGVTLNIGSAVINGSIQVTGVLNARGTDLNPIHITSDYSGQDYESKYYPYISLAHSSIDEDEKDSSASTIENVFLRSTQIKINSAVKITNNTFINSELIISDGFPVISNNIIMSRISICGGSPIISNNNITAGFITFYGQKDGEKAIIASNIISEAKTTLGKNASAIWFAGSQGYGGHVLIERNLITHNSEGIQIFRPNSEELKTSLTIQNNTIINNVVGVSILSPSSPEIIENNIYNNSYNIKLSQDASNVINATYNWWGTTDTSVISQSNFDFEDDSNLGTVNFIKLLTAPNPEAKPDSNVSPEMSAFLTTPKSEISTLPSPIPTPSLSQERDTELLEIVGIIIAALVLGAGLAFLIYLLKK
jgi:hypothetical protein